MSDDAASLPEVCVVYLLRDRNGHREVLLGRKRHGLGVGKIVAPGGKLEPGESPSRAAVREVREEVGLHVDERALELVGELTYPFPSKPSWSQKSWAFRAFGDWEEPTPSDELESRWIPLVNIPLAQMWDDARFWLLDALNGTPIISRFEFGSDLTTVVDSDHAGFVHPQ
jgi:8-oxo-dGTP diphosphatase